MREQGKNYNIELIRTISFVLVIVIHVTNYFCRAYGRISSAEYGFALILDTLARVSVPCFFMISGALLLGKEEPFRKNTKRLLRFVTVLLFWSLVYYVHNKFYMGTPVYLRKILYEPTEPHLWYLYAMIPIYLVLPFFQAMIRGLGEDLVKPFVVIGGAAVCVMYLLSFSKKELYYDLPLIGDRVYAYYFILGYFLWKYKDTIKISVRKLLIGFAASGVIMAALTAVISVKKEDHYERILEYGCPLVMVFSVSFFLLMLRLGDGTLTLPEKVRKTVDVWCSCSFGIYLIHILFLDNYKKYVAADAYPIWIAVPVLISVLLAVSFGCTYLIRKIPFGRKIT